MKRFAFLFFAVLLAGGVLSAESETRPPEQKPAPSPALLAAQRRVAGEVAELLELGGDQLGYAKYIAPVLAGEPGLTESDRTRLKNAMTFHRFVNRPRGDFRSRRRGRNQRREGIDPFALLSGGLAIRESLQTESIRASATGESSEPIGALAGPTIKSHPFKEMMRGRKSEAFPLARFAPHDFYYLHLSNIQKAVELLNDFEELGFSFYNRYSPVGVSFRIKDRIMTQLGIRLTYLGRKFGDAAIEELAVVGSDPFVRNGSDVSVLFKVKRDWLFEKTIRGFRAYHAEKFGVQSETIRIAGIKTDLLRKKDRRLHSFMLRLAPDVVLITNSRRAAEVLIRTARQGRPALAGADEFRYMRSIYPAAKDTEDAFLYLSDAFIRRLVGPEVRIKEARRMHEAVRLANLEKLIIYYARLFGEPPARLEDLGKIAPADFPENSLAGYSVAGESLTAFHETYGRLGLMKPNLETDLTRVSSAEAAGYRNFVKEYSAFWSKFFDPIGIRFKRDGAIRVETCILPLIENSLYNSLTRLVGGAPVALQSAGDFVPGEVFSAAAKLNKDSLRKIYADVFRGEIAAGTLPGDLPERAGRSIQINALDSRRLVDFETNLLFQTVLRRGKIENPVFAVLIWSLFQPMRISLPLVKAGDNDRLLDGLIAAIAGKIPSKRATVRRYSMDYRGHRIHVLRVTFFEVLTFRLYITLLHDRVILTTTRNYMQRTVDAAGSWKGRLKSLFSSRERATGNVLGAYRPGQMRLEKDLYRASLLEAAQAVSFRNFGTYRLLHDLFGAEAAKRKSLENFGFQLNCPAGGTYSLDKKGRVSNSFFGTGQNPRIDFSGVRGRGLARILDMNETRVRLRFTREGIRTTVLIR